MCFILFPLAYIMTQVWHSNSTPDDFDPVVNAPSLLPELSMETLMFMESMYIPASHEEVNETQCNRFPLPSLNYFNGERTYRHFDDILLIVFFSHARYDANLDYYREVYAEFFPNVSSAITR